MIRSLRSLLAQSREASQEHVLKGEVSTEPWEWPGVAGLAHTLTSSAFQKDVFCGGVIALPGLLLK